MAFSGTVRNYIEVLKVRETLLLGFIGLCSLIIAGQGRPPIVTLLFATATILVASAGANGLTNYLDRDIDARMRRTCWRALPSKAIYPASKVLLADYCFNRRRAGAGLAAAPLRVPRRRLGTLVAVTWRKKMTCVFPQGALASIAPVLMGWLAVTQSLTAELWLLCAVIAAWLPLHVWSVNIAHRDDYISAGITFFPMNVSVRTAVLVLLVFALVLDVTAVWLYFVAGFNLLYLLVAIILGLSMLYATVRLVASHTSKDAWKLYKLSSFPYLGIVFIAMCVSIWLK